MNCRKVDQREADRWLMCPPKKIYRNKIFDLRAISNVFWGSGSPKKHPQEEALPRRAHISSWLCPTQCSLLIDKLCYITDHMNQTDTEETALEDDDKIPAQHKHCQKHIPHPIKSLESSLSFTVECLDNNKKQSNVFNKGF